MALARLQHCQTNPRPSLVRLACRLDCLPIWQFFFLGPSFVLVSLLLQLHHGRSDDSSLVGFLGENLQTSICGHGEGGKPNVVLVQIRLQSGDRGG